MLAAPLLRLLTEAPRVTAPDVQPRCGVTRLILPGGAAATLHRPVMELADGAHVWMASIAGAYTAIVVEGPRCDGCGLYRRPGEPCHRCHHPA